ncbi:MAG: UDP-N-acetylmuramoyl-tripeptide--D-alanyl-D-alanine ligase [Candidatus Babeliales bacterium]
MLFDELFIQRMLTGQVLYGAAPLNATFSIDTRTLVPGDIFVALEGENFDGHSFIAQALKKGASGVILASDKKDYLTGIDASLLHESYIVAVSDPSEALFALASAWRAQFEYPVVGITGSVGKTSTRELISHILHKNAINHLATHNNENSALGVALTLLRMRNEHKVALIEMGVSKRGEMKHLAQLVRPTIGVITAIGHSHMEGLGSVHDIAAEKRDIFAYFKESNIGVINGDQAVLASVAYRHPVIKVGEKTSNQIQARKIQLHDGKSSFVLKIYDKKFSVSLATSHHGPIMNALAATAVTHLLKVPWEVIAQAIGQQQVVAGRFEAVKLKAGKGVIINDCYNANPESMKAALIALQNMDTSAAKIAVLGDMLELGSNGPFWHRQLGRFLRKVPSLRHVVLVGTMVEWTKKTIPLGLEVESVATWQEAVALLEKQLHTEAVVLVKGSRNIGLTNLVQAFREL